jgi:hypothetical protein
MELMQSSTFDGASIEGAGEVFHCFAGGWVRIPWKVNFDRFE